MSRFDLSLDLDTMLELLHVLLISEPEAKK